MKPIHDLIGIGIGPFNLSLAALSASIPGFSSAFFEQKEQFEWHSELVFPDACMQTTFLKDLVTPVDPTNPCSFLNYLVQRGSFYAFLNTGRRTITRREFEDYCRWVSRMLPNTNFQSPVREIHHDGKDFQIKLDRTTHLAKSICIGTGLSPHIPEIARPHLGPACFHAKSKELKDVDFTGKRVVIIGGGQTGAEIFFNGLKGLWGEARSTHWVSRRLNLEALDESAFANDYFTPDYVNRFHNIEPSQKDKIVASQKMTSDGITPTYLEAIYNELYQKTHVEGSEATHEILTGRAMVGMKRLGHEFEIIVNNQVRLTGETYFADLVILATGFKNLLPACLEPLLSRIDLDERARPKLLPNFQMQWDGMHQSRLYAVNFGRHTHGIAEPQTSLMAWRSASILNDALGRDYFAAKDSAPAFLRH